MKHEKVLRTPSPMAHHLGCFGDFSPRDRVCAKFCALSLRCAIEKEKNSRMEILEDMVYSDELFITVQ
ncbi:MAG: hypothetical protein WAV08_10585 [Desulfobacterales bacterium]|nr:hypothetical protein [Desulfobacterales bacterium]MDZ7597141.1 hypothetical protein [Desulfobacterales bacterium]